MTNARMTKEWQYVIPGRLADRGISGSRDASFLRAIPRRCAPRDDRFRIPRLIGDSHIRHSAFIIHSDF
jgi:hypothetical protein